MFEGFSGQTIDFLWGVRFNNRRDWFLEHRQEYETCLYRPMLALADQVRERFQIEGTILKASRIYRDRRYASVPYKDYLWFVIREDQTSWSEHPSLYFQIEPERGQYGFINYAPPAAKMAAHRKRITEHPGEFAKILCPILGGGVFTDRSTRYKRPKEGSPAGEENWYQMKNCYVAADIPVGPELFDKNLADRLVEGFEQLTPLYHYWRRLEASAS